MFEGGITGIGMAGWTGLSGAACSLIAASDGSALSANCVACRAASRSPSTEDRINDGRVGAFSDGASTLSIGSNPPPTSVEPGRKVATATPPAMPRTAAPMPKSDISRNREPPAAANGAPAAIVAALAPPITALRAAASQSGPLSSLPALPCSSAIMRRACWAGTFASRSSVAAAPRGPCSARVRTAKNQSCSGIRRLSSGVPLQGETRKPQCGQA